MQHRPNIVRVSVTLALLALAACGSPFTPYTTAPAVALGAYDSFYKREQWQEYADTGDVYAMWELGKSYEHSRLQGGKEPQRAAYWYCKAAENGYAKAQIRVAQILETTQPIKNYDISHDKLAAYIWYRMAARRVNEEGIVNSKRLKEQLSDDQKTQAELELHDAKLVRCPQKMRRLDAH